MKILSELKGEMSEVLAAIRAQISGAGSVEATVICIPRHGFGTTRTTLESLYENTERPFHTIYVDIASPPAVRSYLETQASERDDFFHLRVDEFVSRQTARLLALEVVQSPYVAFLDNNMLVSENWLGQLLIAANETGAAMVSPILVTQGGDIHFSAGRIERRDDGIVRPHFQEGGRTKTKIADARLKRIDIDFAESHACLADTEAMRIPGVLDERLHNAQTLCCAGYALQAQHGRRLVIEPTAVASILPISFGYDLPWMCESYMDPGLIAGSYAELVSLMGPGPSNDLEGAMNWHQKHFKYLLATMTRDDRLTRQDLLRPEEVPENIVGYDYALPEGTDRLIQQDVIPYVDRVHPELRSRLDPWLQ